MDDNKVKINELSIRLFADFKDQAQIIGRLVTQRVADGLPADIKNRKLDSLKLKINVSEGVSQSTMVKSISDAILKGLI